MHSHEVFLYSHLDFVGSDNWQVSSFMIGVIRLCVLLLKYKYTSYYAGLDLTLSGRMASKPIVYSEFLSRDLKSATPRG